MPHVYVSRYCIVTKKEFNISAFPDTNIIKNPQENYNKLYGLNKEYYPAPYPNHKGTDYLTPAGTKVYGINNFKVKDIYYSNEGLGNHIEITNGRISFIFAHLSKINVSKSQNINEDMVIGETGNTGSSQGPHLHIQTFLTDNTNDWVDSTPYMSGDWKIPYSASNSDKKYKKPTDDVIDAVIKGDYGNQPDRQVKLEAEGYNYDEVQNLVNKKLEGNVSKHSKTRKELSTVAKEIFYGVKGSNPWGDGEERKNKLKNAGYTDSEIKKIQELVNKFFD